jgi:hypothetical protein
MGFLEDLSTVLVDAAVGVVGTGYADPTRTIFRTTKAVIPDGPGPYISLISTGGTGDERTHNSVAVPSYEFPGAQVVLRGINPVEVQAKAKDAHRAIGAVRNRTINGTHYRDVKCLQQPFDDGVDDTSKRIVYKFNVLGDRSG